MRVITDLPTLPPRSADSHKGTFGKVLVVAGSRDMSGAAVLCGSAALRGGAGLVQVATPADVQARVAIGNPCFTTFGLPFEVEEHGLSEDAAPIILELAETASVLAMGPGMGLSAKVPEIVQIVLVQAELPIVLDADGINALTKVRTDVLKRRPAPTVVTPHPGEFGRLLKLSKDEVQTNREELAMRFAADHFVVLVLKGNQTIVTDGDRVYRNTTGNPGMASGGTGDVLTGLIAALIAQGMKPFEAAQLGVYVHGRAGDLAAEALGQVGLIASDVIEYLPRAFRSHS
jgi:ADP-dependent NAD(P)H-hydrate dehydratase